jgi:hypothetical protein
VTVQDLEVGTRDDYGFPVDLDPDKNLIWSSFGRKGSGKSYINRALFRAYPYAKLCIDVNGNADPGPGSVPLKEPLPSKMPRPDRDPDTGARVFPNLHYLANPMSKTYREDLDRAVGMSLFPQDQNTLVWIGELNQFSTASRTPPALSTLLQQSRHYHTSALFDCPRPVDIDKLVISQADVITIFDMPDPDDRDRVAKLIGYPAPRFRAECDETFARGEHWYLLWNTATRDLFRCPPLPKGIA